jgi:hypothetical protein
MHFLFFISIRLSLLYPDNPASLSRSANQIVIGSSRLPPT